MKKLDELLLQIGLNKSNGLFYLKDDRWKTDTAFPGKRCFVGAGLRYWVVGQFEIDFVTS